MTKKKKQGPFLPAFMLAAAFMPFWFFAPSSGLAANAARDDGIRIGTGLERDEFTIEKDKIHIRMPLDARLGDLKYVIDLLNGGKGGDGLTLDTINTKWNISTAGSEYASIELSGQGGYIVVGNKEKPDVHIGIYQIQDRKTIKLLDLGTMVLESQTGDAIRFSFTGRDGQNIALLDAAKAENVAESSRTDLLCRTWRLIRYDGQDTKDTAMDDVFFFSKAGTYLVTYPDREPALAGWRWQDAQEKVLQYSWDNFDSYGIARVNILDNQNLQIEDAHGRSSGVPANILDMIPLNGE
ncbi:MAG: hypothetical protein LBP76_15010 [Treponema sp.]|jgi:hypothetical protein|nr:hypothetical protein [Treponema sp.]